MEHDMTGTRGTATLHRRGLGLPVWAWILAGIVLVGAIGALVWWLLTPDAKPEPARDRDRFRMFCLFGCGAALGVWG